MNTAMLLVSSIIFPVIFIENNPLIINLLYIGAKGDSGSPVFDENGILWGILHGRNENHGSCAVVPINEILDDARQNGMDFRLM